MKTKTDEGVAGLTILLSLVTMLFVIGLLVMIFSLMGGEMIGATYTSTTQTVVSENVVEADFIDGTGFTLLDTGLNNASWTIVALYNNTNELLAVGNYTLTANVLSNATEFNGGADMFVNYTYIYDAENTATGVMNDTTVGIASVTDWFPIFIVIGAMVVLILLTVIIIVAIRSSGLINSGSA